MKHLWIIIVLPLLGVAAQQPATPSKTKQVAIVPARPAEEQPSWNVELAPDTQGRVRVLVDLERFSSLVMATEVKVSVEFYDAQGKKLGDREFTITDLSQPVLFGGRKYARDFDHGYTGVVRAAGKNLNCKLTRDVHVAKPSTPDPTKGKA